MAVVDCWGKTRVKQASIRILLLTTVGLLCWGHCAEATELIYRFGRQGRALARTASRRTDAIKRSARRHLGALFPSDGRESPSYPAVGHPASGYLEKNKRARCSLSTTGKRKSFILTVVRSIRRAMLASETRDCQRFLHCIKYSYRVMFVLVLVETWKDRLETILMSFSSDMLAFVIAIPQ